MNTTDTPTQPIDCLDDWICKTLGRCALVIAYIAEHDRLGDIFEDMNEICSCMYAAQCYLNLVKTKQITLT